MMSWIIRYDTDKTLTFLDISKRSSPLPKCSGASFIRRVSPGSIRSHIFIASDK